MKRKNIFLIVIIIVITLFITVSCTEYKSIEISNNLEPNSTNNDTNSEISIDLIKNNPSTSNVQQSDINIDELKKAIKLNINYDLWCYGKYSEFNGVEKQTSDIEIYNIKDEPSNIYIYFNKQFAEEGNSNISKGKFYLVIYLIKHKNGYSSELGGYWKRETEEEAKNELKAIKCELVQKSTITFNAIMQPEFLQLTGEGLNNFNRLKSNLSELISKQGELDKGEYKAYIRKFNDLDSMTYVLVEDNRGNSWKISVEFDDNSYISVDKFYKTNSDIRKFEFEQLKKISYNVDKITIK